MALDDRIARRMGGYDWEDIRRTLDARGWSRLPDLLTATECKRLTRLYDADDEFRSTIDMQRHGYGRGQYRYLRYPLPEAVQSLRRHLYRELRPIAETWAARLGRDRTYPPTLEGFLSHCHARGQKRPTPLLLRYGEGDFNRLHQDVYGEVQFPLQALVLLSQSERDYGGGEVVFVEQKPRTQSRPIVIVPKLGEALIFTNRERPARGTRGDYAVQMRHGASELSWGERYVLGIIFHDAA